MDLSYPREVGVSYSASGRIMGGTPNHELPIQNSLPISLQKQKPQQPPTYLYTSTIPASTATNPAPYKHNNPVLSTAKQFPEDSHCRATGKHCEIPASVGEVDSYFTFKFTLITFYFKAEDSNNYRNNVYIMGDSSLSQDPPRLSISPFTVKTTKPFTMTLDVSHTWMKYQSLSEEDIYRAAAHATCYEKRQHEQMTQCGSLFTIGTWAKGFSPDDYDILRFTCSGCTYNGSSLIDPFYTPLLYYVIHFTNLFGVKSNPFILRKGNSRKRGPPSEESQASEGSMNPSSTSPHTAVWHFVTPSMIKKYRTDGVPERLVSGNTTGRPSPSVTPIPLDATIPSQGEQGTTANYSTPMNPSANLVITTTIGYPGYNANSLTAVNSSEEGL
ncbi:hypothetical protein Pelo_1223 [Pelomyxa schiedti]|nr:hypothetical protein Pelo_1223 [Pelomyxa schiedti]